ncbi:Imm63 family immunity protein [Mucilaginibacter lacusdianchii]|uniref:Imm63 family immunity protein n=1 Tax=Mucilaginibacter lacusdianchii TaxID=2684211 RepID=UPI00131DAEBE|nr:Imm63 family immunity protein [Mucilaginibacter sp. JXJ CY 39]
MQVHYTLKDVQTVVQQLAEKIQAPPDLLPTYGYSRDFAYPHIETDRHGQLHFVVIERGREIDRRTTHDLDELLFWIFSGITFSMAGDYELHHRQKGQDCRRILFSKQEELLGILNQRWMQREQVEHQQLLRDYPFDDLAG